MPGGFHRTMLLPVVGLLVPLWAADVSSPARIDTDRSILTIHVYKAGLFSAFGHNHEISAPIQSGSFSETPPEVELSVEARKLRVLDTDVSDKDRNQIQATMLGPQVLDSEKFPEIQFQSKQVERLGEDKWVVHGNLVLHGQTRRVEVKVERQSGRYFGSVELKQKDFGIAPVSIAGGSVKVKNEVRIDFQIVGR
jgi:polyisoprenoid-binding protein YceI